jgi:hypothetical protein
MASNRFPESHIEQLTDNLNEVGQLLDIHRKVAGVGPGRKYSVEALNKSAIVLLVACWEAFVEDLAEAGLRAMVASAKDHSFLPELVLERVAAKNPGRQAWSLAGEGWKIAVESNLKEVLARTTGALNTPRTAQVDELFLKTLGVPKLSQCWSSRGKTAHHAQKRLDDLVTLRGSIAHRVKYSNSVRKRDVTIAADFIGRLAEKSHNRIRSYIHETTGFYPWRTVAYEGRK